MRRDGMDSALWNGIRTAGFGAASVAIFSIATTVVHAAANPEEGGKPEGGLPQLDVSAFPTQIFWLIISFALLYWIMSKMAVPRIAEVLEERQERITDDLETAERLKSEAEKVQADYEKALAEARSEAQGHIKAANDEAAAEQAKAEAEHDFLNGDITPHEAVLVVACVLEVQLVDMGNLMQEDFAHGHRRGDADLGRLPIAALLFDHTPKRKEADFFGHRSEMENPATNANAFAQREVERDTRKTQPESDVVVNALQLGPGGQPGHAKPGVPLGCPDQGRQSLRCSPDVAEHERKPGVSGQLVGKGPKGGGREG